MDTQTIQAPVDLTQTVSNASTNAEIRQVFENFPGFKDGKAILASIEVKENVVRTMFVQNRLDLPITTNTNPLLALAMKWDNNIGRTVRTWQNFDVDLFSQLQEAGVTVGSTAEQVFSALKAVTNASIEFTKVKIAVTENHTPDSWANEHGEETLQRPLTTSKGVGLTSKGLPIYQHTELCFDDSIVDTLLTPDKIINLRQS